MNEKRRTLARPRGRLRIFGTLLAATLLLGSAACVHHPPSLLNMQPDELFQRGMEKYRGHHWDNAIAAFQQFTFRFPTHARLQEARFMLAQSYFGKKEYVTAATEFSRLANDFPSGPWADDARFRVCEAYDRLSPKVELDQQYTQAAFDHCQSLIAYYPDSPFVPKAKEIAERMKNKLARKIYIGGEYYFRRHAYDSAILYYEDAVSKYPDTPVAPRALLRVVEAYQKIGWSEEAEAAKQRLLQAYPDSQAARSLQADDGKST